jgi:hypothetical protein
MEQVNSPSSGKEAAHVHCTQPTFAAQRTALCGHSGHTSTRALPGIIHGQGKPPEEEMSGKPLDLSLSVHALCITYPELAQALADIGFVDIVKPGMLQSVGRFMTLPMGARMRKIPLDTIKEKLAEQGFTVVSE